MILTPASIKTSGALLASWCTQYLLIHLRVPTIQRPSDHPAPCWPLSDPLFRHRPSEFKAQSRLPTPDLSAITQRSNEHPTSWTHKTLSEDSASFWKFSAILITQCPFTVWRPSEYLLPGLRSRPNFSNSDSDSDSGLEKSTPTPIPTPAPTHMSLFFHMSKSNVLKQWYLLCNALDAKYCVQTRQQSSVKKFARTSYCELGDNYPAVNQNGLSDRNLP